MKTTTLKRAVIYCRVSTKEQVDEGNSLVTQEKICKDYALKNGYEIVALFIERGESAKTQNRPELQRLFKYCADRKHNRIDAVIAYKIDRISRNTDDYSQIRLLLRKYDVEIKSTSEHFENTPAGRFMENMVANVSQFDNDVRTERSVNGMKDAMREGRYVWQASWGYSNVRVDGKVTIAQNNNAVFIRQAFEEVAKNARSVNEVRLWMNTHGLVNSKGKPFAKGWFYKMLQNEMYAGWIVKFGERHKGLFEPIVSQELFDQVQCVLKGRAHKGFVYRRENPDFPLRRFVFHPTGLKMTGAWSKGKYKKYPYYRFVSVPHSQIRKEQFEETFVKYLNTFALDDALVQRFEQGLPTAYDRANERDYKEAKRLRVYVADLKEKRSVLIDKNCNGVITDTILKEQLGIIENKIMVATSELYNLPEEDGADDIQALFTKAKAYVSNPGELWRTASPSLKIKLQWFQFPQGIMFDGEELRTLKVASIFKVKELISDNSPLSPEFAKQQLRTPKKANVHKANKSLSPNLSAIVPLASQNYEHSANKILSMESTLQHQIAKEIKNLAEILKDG